MLASLLGDLLFFLIFISLHDEEQHFLLSLSVMKKEVFSMVINELFEWMEKKMENIRLNWVLIYKHKGEALQGVHTKKRSQV